MPSHDRLQRVVRLAFWAALIFALVMALLPKPPRMPTDPLGDKVNHVLAFLTMTALAIPAYRQVPRWRLLARLSLFGALIEVLQAIPVLHRDSDPLDWLADTAAVLAVIGLAAIVARLRRGRAQ